LELIAARPPPVTPDRLLSSYNASATGTNPSTEIGTGLYSSGVMIGASVYNQDTFCLTGISPDLAFVNRTLMWSEMNSFLYVDGQAFAVAEVPHVHKYPCDALGVSFNELDTQVTMSPRQFVVLSDLGISMFSKRRPIDYLLQLLQEGNGKLNPSLRAFFESFGPEQTCAMCLAIACGNPYV
jgi:nuclear pore complex protein Nup155